MKETSENLVKFILDVKKLEFYWLKDYFPFTEPSFELNIKFNDEWIEIMGCGVLHKDVLNFTNKKSD